METGHQLPPVQGRATLFMIVAAVDIVVMAVITAGNIWYRYLLADPVRLIGEPGRLQFLETFWMIVGALHLIGFVVSVILFLVWHHRVRRQLSLVNPAGVTYTPGWALAWWFIPIANLFKPFLVVRETWHASHGHLASEHRAAPLWLLSWWLTFLIGNTISAFAQSDLDTASSLDQVAMGVNFRIVETPLMIVSALFLMWFVRQTTREMMTLKLMPQVSAFD
jgi:hypothetical protein